VPFGGKYRIIDFILSNFVNSEFMMYRSSQETTTIRWLTILAPKGMGPYKKNWRLADFISFFRSGSIRQFGKLSGTIDALHKSMHSIKRSRADYVILSGCNFICSMNYDDILKSHIERNADITAIYTNPREDVLNPSECPCSAWTPGADL
jgi:glucose-1-phosphate adenylyltransferase